MKLRPYPTSDEWWVYAALISAPCAGMLATIILYRYLGDSSPLADQVCQASKYVAIYSAVTCTIKIARLAVCGKGQYACSRLKVIGWTILANVFVLVAYTAYIFR